MLHSLLQRVAGERVYLTPGELLERRRYQPLGANPAERAREMERRAIEPNPKPKPKPKPNPNPNPNPNTNTNTSPSPNPTTRLGTPDWQNLVGDVASRGAAGLDITNI